MASGISLFSDLDVKEVYGLLTIISRNTDMGYVYDISTFKFIQRIISCDKYSIDSRGVIQEHRFTEKYTFIQKVFVPKIVNILEQ